MNENCCRKDNHKNIPLACEAARARAGELNSVSEYLYLSIMFADAYPELSEYFEKLSMEEMHHHRALGELILRLGGDPAERSTVRNSGRINLCEDRDSRAPVAAQVRAIFPVFWGISGSYNTICNIGVFSCEKIYFGVIILAAFGVIILAALPRAR